MIINKVINNNVLSTHDENNREIVLMGKGIGFQKKVGDEVAEDKTEKRFVLDSEDEVGKFSELIEMIPHNYLKILYLMRLRAFILVNIWLVKRHWNLLRVRQE